MNLSTQQLQYLIEIERTRSVSQAAANLYMGQPNLSRILRDTEVALGFDIFERTRKGVRPTEKGEQFLEHARNILREAEFMERMGPNKAQPNRFRICLPRSYGFLNDVRQYLCELPPERKLDAVIRECHPRQALELLGSSTMEIAVIRYCVEYQDYFSEQASARKLSIQPLSQVEYQILLPADSPLSVNVTVSRSELEHCTELLHRDTFFPANQIDDKHYRIYTVDRMAQLQLLQVIPNAYLWSEPLPKSMLETYCLAQRPCREGGTRYQNALIYKPQCAMSAVEREFLQWIKEREA
ncbi:MAG: LysR family transcriptional regulator [Faecousia sp.]